MFTLGGRLTGWLAVENAGLVTFHLFAVSCLKTVLGMEPANPATFPIYSAMAGECFVQPLGQIGGPAQQRWWQDITGNHCIFFYLEHTGIVALIYLFFFSFWHFTFGCNFFALHFWVHKLPFFTISLSASKFSFAPSLLSGKTTCGCISSTVSL